MPYISSGAPECLSCTRPQDFSPVHLTRTIGIDSTYTSLLAGNTPVSACSPRSSKVVSFSLPQIRQRWHSVYIKGSLAGSQESVNHKGPDMSADCPRTMIHISLAQAALLGMPSPLNQCASGLTIDRESKCS